MLERYEKDLDDQSPEAIRHEMERVKALYLDPLTQRLERAEARKVSLKRGDADYQQIKEKWLAAGVTESEWQRIARLLQRATMRRGTARWRAKSPAERLEVWTRVKTKIQAQGSHVADNITPGRWPWMQFALGISQAHLRGTVNRTGGALALVLNGTREWNLKMFQAFWEERDKIEAEIGTGLIWNRQAGSGKCQLRVEQRRLDIVEEAEDLEAIADFFAKHVICMEIAFRRRLPRLRANIE